MKNNILYDTDKYENKPLKRKKVILIILIIWFLLITYVFTFIFGYEKSSEKYKGILVQKELEFADFKAETYCSIFEEDNIVENPYAHIPFLFNNNSISDEQATYIIKLANALNIDPDFCIALLNKENPELNEIATSKKNANGTVDIGMWQLNQSNLNGGKYSFDKIYWPFDIPFDPWNWKHNTWVALHHIQDLYQEFGDYEKVAQAYNGGASKVRKNKVVTMAKKYGEIVIQTYNNLKNYS